MEYADGLHQKRCMMQFVIHPIKPSVIIFLDSVQIAGLNVRLPTIMTLLSLSNRKH